jgi:hypothetical protein
VQVGTTSSSISLSVTRTSCSARVPLDLVVQGILSDIDITLDSAFSGAFDVASILGSVSVAKDNQTSCDGVVHSLLYDAMSATTAKGSAGRNRSTQVGPDSLRVSSSFQPLNLKFE